jgi:hypothetical protein
MGALADHQHDLMRAKGLLDVFDGREDEQLLMGVALLADSRERRSREIETLAADMSRLPCAARPRA